MWLWSCAAGHVLVILYKLIHTHTYMYMYMRIVRAGCHLVAIAQVVEH